MSEVFDTITLEFDDDTTVECEEVGVFEAEGREYMALVPVEEAEQEEVGIIFYRYKEGEEEFELEDIESDEEFEKVVAAFEAVMIEEE